MGSDAKIVSSGHSEIYDWRLQSSIFDLRFGIRFREVSGERLVIGPSCPCAFELRQFLVTRHADETRNFGYRTL